MTKGNITEAAHHAGIDLVRFTTRQRLDAAVPAGMRPSEFVEELSTFLVLAKHIPTGISGAVDSRFKQYCGGLVHRGLEEAAGELAYWLEDHGQLAVYIPSLVIDFKSRTALGNCPAGQGSLFLRHAAVISGMGTWGLNLMVLTPQFGPRIFICGMMTDLEVEADEPLAEELCPGLVECGRCAAICPEDAIPRTAPAGARLSSYRSLDAAACARSSQPFGPDRFVEYFGDILRTEDKKEQHEKIQGPQTAEHWQSMAVMRQGAFTGCMRCMQVCPVGRDYPKLSESPHRQQDLPNGVQRTFANGLVTVEREF